MSPNFKRVRVLAATLLVTFIALGAAQVASADNLLLLDSEHAVVSGNLNYGLVYVDGELRITGDTSITAGSIYFGPDAQIETCDIEGVGTNACTSGRSLTLSSSGPVTITNNLSLTAGAGTIRSAGSLSVTGGTVAIGGNVDVSGSGGGLSGAVSIASASTLDTGAINAPGVGPGVTLNAGGTINVGGDINTGGTAATADLDPARVQSAAQVTVTSSGGDVHVEGTINASGRDAPTAPGGTGLGGGNGAPASVTGGDVGIGAIDTTGGSSADYVGGVPGDINLNARGSLSVFGRVDASGSNGKAAGSASARITANAGGAEVLGGGAFANGAAGNTGGTAAAGITLQGQTVDAGQLQAAGGDAPIGNGGPGGAISVVGALRATTGAVDVSGGGAPAGATAANGGALSVRSDFGSVSTGRITTVGGQTPGGNGANGGPVALSAQTNLTVGGTLDTSGSDAQGSVSPPRVGGSAGNVYLRAATGAVVLGATLRAQGGNGAPSSAVGVDGGAGGAGGRLDMVAHATGSIVSIFTTGGDGGGNDTSQGPGGSGGPIYSWSDAPLFDDQKVVSTDGGEGQPSGAAGAKISEMSPTGVTIDPAASKLSFTSRSPDASGYQVVRTMFGVPPQVVATVTSTTGIPIDAPMCVPALFTVIANQGSVNWQSDPSAGVGYLKPPSATQTCAQPPKLKASKSALKFKLKNLKHLHFKAVLKLTTDGIGNATATLTGKVKKGKHTTAKKLLTLKPFAIAKAGSLHLSVTLPAAARKTGSYTLKVVTTAPDGSHHTTTTLKLEVTK